MNLEKIIKEQLSQFKKNIISEMAISDYCKKTFSPIGPELPFCEAAENYIKNEVETSGNFKKKVIFEKFRNGIANFSSDEQNLEDLQIKIEEITENHPIMKEGIEEIKTVNGLIEPNCPNVSKVFERQLSTFKNKVQLYFTENEKYSVTNRLDTNYSAISVLFTKFFQHKGAFDSVEKKLDEINWDEIAKNWIDHSFNPSLKFRDIRSDKDKKDNKKILSTLSFNELCRIYFNNVILFNSKDIRDSVNHVLQDVRKRGFDSENDFEKKYLDEKKEFMRLAKDYGFADRFLGIDFIYKGKDLWIPVQVKSSPTEATFLISSLGCKTYVIAQKTGKTFKINTLHNEGLSY
jgi:hypothetical protein